MRGAPSALPAGAASLFKSLIVAVPGIIIFGVVAVAGLLKIAETGF